MAEKFVVSAKEREGRGKNDSRGLRRKGKVPIAIYGGGGETIAAAAEIKDLAAIIRSDTGANTLFTLKVEGHEESRVIFQDRQIDPVSGRLVHADLRRLSKGEKIEVTIPVQLIGEPDGVRNEGGLLEQQLREIRVLCLPSNIPESIDIDVEELGANESLHVSDAKVSDEIEILESPETLVCSVVFVKEEIEEPEVVDEEFEPGIVGEEGEEGEEGAEPSDEEASEETEE